MWREMPGRVNGPVFPERKAAADGVAVEVDPGDGRPDVMFRRDGHQPLIGIGVTRQVDDGRRDRMRMRRAEIPGPVRRLWEPAYGPVPDHSRDTPSDGRFRDTARMCPHLLEPGRNDSFHMKKAHSPDLSND